MERNSKSARVDEKRAKPASGRFDLISITMHWLTVLLILVQFTSAWQRGALDQNTNFAVALLTTHRTSGVLIWIVSLVRLVWRHNFAYLPPFPKSMPKLHQTLAKANEYSLYALLLIQPITGLERSLFRGAPFEWFICQVPALFAQRRYPPYLRRSPRIWRQRAPRSDRTPRWACAFLSAHSARWRTASDVAVGGAASWIA